MNRNDNKFAKHLDEMRKQYEAGNKEQAVELAELAIVYLAEATINNVTKINKYDIDNLKNRAWFVLEKTGILGELDESKPGKKPREQSSIKDLKIYVFENSQTKEKFTGTRKEFIDKYKASAGEISKIINKIKKSYRGWTLSL